MRITTTQLRFLLISLALLAMMAKPLFAEPPCPPYNPPSEPGGTERAENEVVEPVARPHVEPERNDQE